jgi:predicted CXXCH cytochrome family protein
VRVRTSRRARLAPLTIVGLGTLVGCVDEKIVERELFEEPLTAAGSFIGYSDVEDKLTVCGNCHIGPQKAWEGTAHADAWATLQANPAAQEFCEGCHTVGQLGNEVSEIAGHAATGEARYQDVQCESCHGPGLTHVRDPSDATIPLAAIDVAYDPDVTGCAQCHSGTHHPFVDEWAASRHGEASLAPTSYRTRAGCAECHGGEAALQAFGVNTVFAEQGQNEEIPITCSVCHDPHSARFDGQLRFAVDAPSVEDNLCMKCHHKRAIPDLGEAGTSTRGPHSPQGPLLLGNVGEVGWTPPNFAYNVARIRGTHGTEANERLCAGCHVNAYDIVDDESGDHLFSATGHLFKAIPCLDANGIPTADDSCAMDTTARSFASCTTSGCHGSPDVALSLTVLAQEEIAGLVADLEELLAQVPADQFSSTDTIFTVAEGAQFNAELGAIESSAVHNPFMTKALLRASIAAVEDTYNLPLLAPEAPPSSASEGAGGSGD